MKKKRTNDEKEKRTLTVVIPSFHAETTIRDVLSSIQIQSIRDDVEIIISPDDEKDDYSNVINEYPDLSISILEFKGQNTGPGLARQRGLDACKTDWVTFIDADDVFINPVSLERLRDSITRECIMVQGPFYQEIKNHPQGLRMMPRNDVGHPWVFGRLYNVKFLRDNKISFSSLRAMEDGELNWKIRMTIEGSPFKINIIEDPIYLWRTGSEHSITRIGMEENEGVPLYNYDLCHVGATVAAINAAKFCKRRNPFNGGITRFITEQMISQYFSYIETKERKEMFAEQTFFNAKRFYNLSYKEIEGQISEDILKTMYTQQMAARGNDLIGIIPELTFFEFMRKVKEEPFNSIDEWKEIRSKLPDWVISLDKKSGVLGDEDYIFADGEKVNTTEGE